MRHYVAYREGYIKALVDLSAWVNRPGAPLVRQLCQPRYLDQVIAHVIENVDIFMDCPDLFSFEFVIEKKRLRITHGRHHYA